MGRPTYLYMIKGPTDAGYQFCTEETFDQTRRAVGDNRPEPFVFIGDGAGGEWRGKKIFKGYTKEN